MAIPYEYQQRIRACDWEDLRKLWRQIQSRDTPDWELGKAFEYLIIRMFELDNATVRYPYTVTQRTNMLFSRC